MSPNKHFFEVWPPEVKAYREAEILKMAIADLKNADSKLKPGELSPGDTIFIIQDNKLLELFVTSIDTIKEGTLTAKYSGTGIEILLPFDSVFTAKEVSDAQNQAIEKLMGKSLTN